MRTHLSSRHFAQTLAAYDKRRKVSQLEHRCTCLVKGCTYGDPSQHVSKQDILGRFGADAQKLLIKPSDGTQTPPSVPAMCSCVKYCALDGDSFMCQPSDSLTWCLMGSHVLQE